MSNTIRYQIEPKEISAEGQEILLAPYVIEENNDNSVENKLEIVSGPSYVDLPVIANHNLIEFMSDQEVFFAIYSGAPQVIEFTSTRNLILKANLNWTYKVKNISGNTANILWRLSL